MWVVPSSSSCSWDCNRMCSLGGHGLWSLRCNLQASPLLCPHAPLSSVGSWCLWPGELTLTPGYVSSDYETATIWGRCRVKHFLCEMPALDKNCLCVDTVAVESTVFILSVIIVLVPLLILISYIATLPSREGGWSRRVGRRKAFNTCGSHLTVVSLFYGNIIYMYMQPGNNSFQDQGKFLTLFYNLVTLCWTLSSIHWEIRM